MKEEFDMKKERKRLQRGLGWMKQKMLERRRGSQCTCRRSPPLLLSITIVHQKPLSTLLQYITHVFIRTLLSTFSKLCLVFQARPLLNFYLHLFQNVLGSESQHLNFEILLFSLFFRFCKDFLSLNLKSLQICRFPVDFL